MDEGGERSKGSPRGSGSGALPPVAGALVASLALHLGVLAALVALPRPSETLRLGRDVEIEIVEPAAAPRPLPAPTPLATDEPLPAPDPETSSLTPPTPRAHDRVSSDEASSTRPEAIGGAEVTVGPAIEAPIVDRGEPRPELRDPNERARLEALVVPGRAAASWVVQQDSRGPSVPSGPAGLEVTGGRPQVASASEASSALSEHLRSRAMDRPWLTRTEPRLVPRPDGSLEYRGHAFTARIAPDGAVSFSDRDAVQVDEMLQGGPARFDVTDMVMRGAGQDPYAAEREWFMEHTEEVRARLETEARARERDRALHGVSGRLATLWGQDRPAFLRRRALFRMWDDCEEAGDGLAVRRQIIEFIRATIPRASPDAFTAQELTEMNARRESAMEFAPY